MRGEFREIVPPERLVFTNIAVDAADKPIIEGLTTVTFTERGGKTMMTFSTTLLATCRAWKWAGVEASTNSNRCWRAAVRPRGRFKVPQPQFWTAELGTHPAPPFGRASLISIKLPRRENQVGSGAAILRSMPCTTVSHTPLLLALA